MTKARSSNCCVIIVTYNGEKWIKRCIQSILSSTAVPDIFVVDNGSQDDTISILKSFPQVEIIDNKENLGFGKANNLALKQTYAAGYEYFFLVNQDTRIEKNAVTELLIQSKNTNDAILSPIHLNGKGDALDYVFGSRFKRNQRKFPGHKLFLNDFETDSMKEKYEVKFTNAAFWMLNRKVLQQVGIFHPFFFHYGEDSNYWDRARHLGFKMIVAGKALAYHDKVYKSRRHQSATRFFEKELMKILLDPDKKKGFIHIIFSVFSGAEIVFLNKQYLRIINYFSECISIYKRSKSKVAGEEVDISISN